MIDVSDKTDTLREAVAVATVSMSSESAVAIREGKVPKGNVLEMARAAGTLAAKKTAELIPLCHPIPLDWIEFVFTIQETQVQLVCRVRTVWKTGVEMEALTGVSLAALTIYDMLKPIDATLTISEVRLLEKRGGKSDFLDQFTEPLTGAVVVVSDSTFAGTRQDKSGKICREKLTRWGIQIKDYLIQPDDADQIAETIVDLVDNKKIDLVVTTGGSGLGPKDLTVEATRRVIAKEVPGIAEAARAYGQRRTPYAMLSREICGIRGKSLIVNLPGSSRGASESLDALASGLLHAFKMMRGGGHS